MKTSSKLFLGIASVILLASCTDDDKINGSGNMVTETRAVSEFTKVSSEGVFEVNITEEDTQSVEVTADNNIMPYVNTNVSSNQLGLSLKDGNYSNITLSADIKLVDLNGITNSGTGNINAFNVDEEGEFSVLNSGTANITIQGESDSLEVMNEGTGDFKGYDFQVNSCQIENIGSGDIQVNCTESLDIKITGSGNVYYKGHPSINVNISGSGKVIDAN